MGYYDNPMAYGASSRRSPTISPEDKALQEAGFRSTIQQQTNRILRNQIEMRAQALGIPSSQAYGMASGPLTSNEVLQDVWNRMNAEAKPQVPAPAPATQPSYGKQYTYTDPGDKGYFGMKDYEELASQGASRADMIRYAFSAPSGVGPAVASMLGIRAYDAPTPSSLSYTDPGDKGFFGMKDFEELASQGATLQQIKDYAGKAQYGVGAEAASILGMKPVTEANMILAQADQRVKDFEDSQKRAEEAAKLQREMMVKSQATLAANMARSGKTPSLQIAPSGQTPGTAGTQTFKRRRGQMTTIGSAMSALPGTTAQSSILNV